MSHIGKLTCDLTGQVNPDLLMEAAALAAKQMGLNTQRDAQVLDYYMRPAGDKLPLVVSGPTLKRGLGLKVDAQGPHWIGDTWGAANVADDLRAKTRQAYISMAAMRAAKRLGFEAAVSQTGNNLQLNLVKD